MNLRLIKTIALALAVILAAAAFCSCKLTPGPDEGAEVTAAPTTTKAPDPEFSGMQVVMSSNGNDITLYDFGQSYYNSRNYQYYMYGMISPEQFCDSVIEELSSLLYMLDAADESGIKLTDEESLEIYDLIDTQLEDLLKHYEERVEEGVEDKRAEAIKILEQDLAQDGIDYDSFLELAKRNMLMYKLADKYYTGLHDGIEITEDDVKSYITAQRLDSMDLSMSDFVEAVSAFNEGSGAYPVVIPDDCFSVNHIYLGFDTTTDDEGIARTDTESRKEDEAKLEALFSETEDFDAFMELEKEYGEDPGMDSERFREFGYIIHPDLNSDYFPGFVYASMNLHDGSWTPTVNLENGEDTDTGVRELNFFKLKDGTDIVKVYTDSGVHYIIVNKEYKKGAVDYEVGDIYWESWADALKEEKMQELYQQLMEEWKTKYTIDIDETTIKAKYVPDPSDSGDDGSNE